VNGTFRNYKDAKKHSHFGVTGINGDDARIQMNDNFRK
jgi:hypothetical protein